MAERRAGRQKCVALEECAHQRLHHVGSLEGAERGVVACAEDACVVTESLDGDPAVIQSDMANVGGGRRGAAGAEIAMDGGGVLRYDRELDLHVVPIVLAEHGGRSKLGVWGNRLKGRKKVRRQIRPDGVCIDWAVFGW